MGGGAPLGAEPGRVRARAEGGGRRLAGPVGRTGDPAVFPAPASAVAAGKGRCMLQREGGSGGAAP